MSLAGVDVLAFSPHPDDVEFFCGGSMLLAAQAGLKTAIVDLTEGELSTNGDPVRRSAEREAASELLALATRVSLGLPDGLLGTDGSHRDAVVETLRELAPRVVLAPHWEDRHPDHEAAGRIVREACFFSGVEKYGAGPAHRPGRVYWYMLHHIFEPSVVIDIGPEWRFRSHCDQRRWLRRDVAGAGDVLRRDGGRQLRRAVSRRRPTRVALAAGLRRFRRQSRQPLPVVCVTRATT